MKTDEDACFVRGSNFSVFFVRDSGDSFPARDFLGAAVGSRHRRSFNRIAVTIDRFANTPPGQFRDDQVRVLCAYDGKGRMLLLDGVIKKRDELRHADIERAKRLLMEHRSNVTVLPDTVRSKK